MNWSRLQNYCCPCCNDVLVETPEGYRCSQGNFFIKKADFDKRVSEMYKAKPKPKEDNQSDLNNLGAEEVTDELDDTSFI